MKIGVFDSGLGGLVITKAFIESMPQYDYLYYGDSRHLPYGEKTSGRILSYTLAAMRRLIARDCNHHCLQHRHFDSPALCAAAFPAA